MIAPSDPKNLPLRDIHLPDPVSWWPLAPGWWLLALLCIAAVSLCFLLWRRRQRYLSSAFYQAKTELERIRWKFDLDQNATGLTEELSILLRRISISLYGRRQTASLVGQDWLLFLDQHGGGGAFSNGAGRVLIDAPYRPVSGNINAEALLQLVSDWIETLHHHKKKVIG